MMSNRDVNFPKNSPRCWQFTEKYQFSEITEEEMITEIII